MRKSIILLSVVAMALLGVLACNKSSTQDEPRCIVLSAAKLAQEAKKLVLEPDATKDGIRSIEFTESGRYIICRVVTKADEDLEYICGTYSMNGQTYVMEGYGSVTIEGNQVTIEREEGETTVVEFEEAETYPENDFYTTVARAWKVEKTDLSATINGKTVGVVRSGCDLPALVAELEEKGNLDLNENAVAGFVVDRISFTLAKTIEVAFTEKDSFVGDIALSETGEFSYTLSGATGTSILSGSASGKLDDSIEEGKLYFISNGSVETQGGSSYAARVILVLVPAE